MGGARERLGGCGDGGRERRERDKLVGALVLVLRAHERASVKARPIHARPRATAGPLCARDGRAPTHHVERDDAALPHDPRDVVPLGKLLKDGEALVGRDTAEGLGRLVPDHVFLVRPAQDVDQGGDRVLGRELAKDKGDLVTA